MVLTFSLISFDFFSPGSVSITYSSKTLNYFWNSLSLIDGSSNICWTLIRLFFVCHVLNWAATRVLHISHMSTPPPARQQTIFSFAKVSLKMRNSCCWSLVETFLLGNCCNAIVPPECERPIERHFSIAASFKVLPQNPTAPSLLRDI